MRDPSSRGGADSPLYGSGPGTPYPPLLGDPYATPHLNPYGVGIGRHSDATDDDGSGREAFGSGAEPEPEPARGLVRICGECGSVVSRDRLLQFQGAELEPDDVPDEDAPEDVPGQVDLTHLDHLAVNTSKDDPYGMDALLPAASQDAYPDDRSAAQL